eukprot:1812487-Prymnesium_polylepis.1
MGFTGSKKRHVEITRWDFTLGPEALVHNVLLHVSVNVTLDGGTWSSCAGAGASVSSVCNSFLDLMDRDAHQRPFVYAWLAPGQTIAIKAREEVVDNCPAHYRETDDVGLDAFVKRATWGNSRSLGSSLNPITRTPKKR